LNLEKSDTMGERIGRIRRIDTDFFISMHEFQAKNQKKSVRIRLIRPIRSPIVSAFPNVSLTNLQEICFLGWNIKLFVKKW
jgi:hypothetical protein